MCLSYQCRLRLITQMEVLIILANTFLTGFLIGGVVRPSKKTQRIGSSHSTHCKDTWIAHTEATTTPCLLVENTRGMSSWNRSDKTRGANACDTSTGTLRIAKITGHANLTTKLRLLWWVSPAWKWDLSNTKIKKRSAKWKKLFSM